MFEEICSKKSSSGAHLICFEFLFKKSCSKNNVLEILKSLFQLKQIIQNKD